MVVDDAYGIQQIIKSILSGLDVERIRLASNGEEALEEMLKDPPNLLITDWVMAPMNGRSLIRIMRHQEMQPLCTIPAIVLSGYPTRKFVKQAAAIGVSHFVTKPVSVKTLCVRVAAVLRDSRKFILRNGSYVLEGIDELNPDWQEDLPFLPDLSRWRRDSRPGNPAPAPDEDNKDHWKL